MTGMIAQSFRVGFLMAAASATLIASDSAKPSDAGIPLITDWSTRHVVFSQPRTPEQAAKLRKNIRYQQQFHRTNVRPFARLQNDDPEGRFRRHRGRRGRRIHRDWSWDLGSGATVGAGRFPAKYSFSSTAAFCASAVQPDFVVFGTSLAGASNQGSIVALENLYEGCNGQVPSSYWSYNTGGQILTSPVLSSDGTQVAFTQTDGRLGVVVLLRWTAGGSASTPQTPTLVGPAAYPGCTAPCMTTFALGANSTQSSVYYDYQDDVAFVGDDGGTLHQYTGFFKGTPTEVTSGGWPVSVSANVLTSAVFDDGSGTTFVGDSGGILYSVSSTGGMTASGRIDFGVGLTGGPIIDPSAGVLYALSSNDSARPGGSAGVFQLPMTFAAGSTGTETQIGSASAGTTPVYDGAFDHNYIASSNSTGHMYVCGNPGGDPTLYQVAINAGAIGAALAGPVVSTTGATPCSPVTDVFNPYYTGEGLPQEWVFLSTQAAGSPTPCTGVSCTMNFKVTAWQPGMTYNTGQEILDPNLNIEVAENNGTSGATEPTWPTFVFSPTNDNDLHWRNQGPVLSTPPDPSWAANTDYNGAFEIIDSNNNVEIVYNLGGGTSGGTQPTWATGEGDTTADGGVLWYNLGLNPVAGLPSSGGSSGIIIDNLIDNPGGSQVYFTNLLDIGCDNGVGGCAVQASQQGLQ